MRAETVILFCSVIFCASKVLIVQEMNQQRFVNVDMTSSEGLERAKALNLASSKVPDIVISDILQGTLEVFNNREFSFNNISDTLLHIS